MAYDPAMGGSRVSVGYRMSTGLVTGLVTLALPFLLVGCGGSGKQTQKRLSEDAPQAAVPAGLGVRHEGITPGRSTPPQAAPPRCVAAVAPGTSSRSAYAALVNRQAVVYRLPRPGASAITRVEPVGNRGIRQVLGVIGAKVDAGCAPAWYRVQLSVLPNGTTGWIRAAAVTPFRVRSRIVVDLSRRDLRLFRGSRLVLEVPVAVGATTTPTPTGRFFINERYVLPDSSGPFGPNALGISAHSTVLQNTWVENGPIAIHGTNAPWSIGRAASHGCIRVSNDVMRQLFPLAPAGTPVVVTP